MNQTKTYQCPICKLEYDDQKWAEKCHSWCKNHKSCNLDIAKHAINKKILKKIKINI